MGLDDREVDRLRAAVGDATFDHRFELVREAGKGGMGRVFEAIDRASGERVAVKIVANLADRARFTAEAEILEQLDHPAIVKYVRHGITNEGDPYLAMTWLVGEPLSKRLERGALDIAATCTLGERLASALDHAHAAGIVHRDVKPSNIVLVGDAVDTACLIDFGIAKTAERDLTHTGQLVGTPGYMAPEQVRGEKDVDRRVDLFALGCVLYEALSMRTPFGGAEVMEVLARLLLEQPAAIDSLVPTVPPRLARLIAALLVKHAPNRLADARVVRDELAAIRAALAINDTAALAAKSPDVPDVADDDTAHQRPAGALPVPVPAAKPRRWWLALAGAAVIAGAITIVVTLTGPDDNADRDTRSNGSGSLVAPCTQDQRDGCRAACDAGDGEACFRWAQSRYTGFRGVAKDPADAIEIYARGCELGTMKACVSGARALLRDRPRDAVSLERAERLLAQACERGSGDACRHLGMEYLPGRAFADDPVRALDLLAKSCELSVLAACIELRKQLDAGQGDTATRTSAEDRYKAACARMRC